MQQAGQAANEAIASHAVADHMARSSNRQYQRQASHIPHVCEDLSESGSDNASGINPHSQRAGLRKQRSQTRGREAPRGRNAHPPRHQESRSRDHPRGHSPGIEGLSAHDARRYWETYEAQDKTAVDRLMDAGGWSSAAMPLRYIESAHIANEGTARVRSQTS